MTAAIKYLIIWLLINTVAGIVALVLGYLLCAVIGHPFPGLEDMLNYSWYTASTLLATNVLVMYVFWKMKYTRFGLNFGFNYGGDFSAKALYLWAGVSAIGLLLFDLMAGFYLPIPGAPDVVEMLMQMMKNPIGLISVCVIGPLAEEVIFRGAIERRLLEKNWNPWFAIVISALFFAVAHFNFSQGFTATVIGIFMGWVYYRTRSIWPGVLIHVVNNTAASLIALASPEMVADENYVLPLSWGIPLTVVSIVLIAIAASRIARLTKDRTPVRVPVDEVLPPPLPAGYAPAVQEVTPQESCEMTVNTLPQSEDHVNEQAR